MPISCLSGKNYSVIAVPTDELDGLISSCTGFATVLVPARWAAASSNLSGDIPMTWTDPDCKPCERRGGVCGFKSETNRDIGCSVNHEAVKNLVPKNTS
ncbi:hypothetical protein L1049_021994 [Liquidambar formosana]|uniref:RING-type E3 ubiquitin transferase n=1 Tax=Liquidambar formosana TaxID=63359 RepID=A0AAP0RBV5_LIQFO